MIKTLARYGVLAALLVLAVVLPLELVEATLADRPLVHPGDRSITTTPDVIDPARPGVSLFQFDLYPFTGGHTQANMSVNQGQFRTAKHGFITDVDVDAPPPKRPGEIRLIMIGGSAAAGHGARSNDSMMHSVMQREFKCEGKTLRVINLAMGGSVTYQNFIALNLWGHKLQPDAILSFSGNNDQNVSHAPDYDGYPITLGLQALGFSSNNRGLAALLAERYPNLVNRTPLGIALRALSFEQLRSEAWANYSKGFPDVPKAQAEIERYIHSINSIRRDFAELPVFVAYQPFMASERNPGKTLTDWKFDVPGRLKNYRNFIDQTAAGLQTAPQYGPLAILDIHRWYQETLADSMDPGDGTHMWDNKQELVARHLLEKLQPPLCA